MALDTYAALKTSVLNWLARPGDPLVEPAVPDMVKLFEAEANRRLRTIDAEKSVLLAMTDAGYAVLPSDCWGIRRVNWGGMVLQYMAPGSPPFGNVGGWSNFYTLLGSNDGGRTGETGEWNEFRIYFGPQAAISEQQNAVEVIYQVGVPPLSDARPANWLLKNHCDAYLWGVLAEAELYIGHDERAPMWLQRREAVFASIEAFDRKTRWAGPMQVRVDAITVAATSQGTGAQLPTVIVDEAAGPLRVENPASGAAIALLTGEGALYIEGGPRAALTIRLPDNPVEGQTVDVSFENPVTALSITYSGGLPLSEPTNAYGPGAGLQFRFVDDEWRYWT